MPPKLMRLAILALMAALAGCSRTDLLPGSGVAADAGAPQDLACGIADGGPAFTRIVLTATFYSEGASYGDFDRDGHADVVAGPYWYAGPDFTRKHAIYPPVAFPPQGYSDNFFAFPYDLDQDGWLDVLFVGFPGQEAYWYRNPQVVDAPWTRHVVFDTVDDESPAFVDVTGDGLPELVCAHGGALGWAAPDWTDTTKPWTFHPLSADEGYVQFTHGLGVGDVDGDGRADLLEAKGVRYQPASLAGDPIWSFLGASFGPGGAQMFAYDVNADSRADVITSLEAHGHGLAWFEQTAPPTAFVEHVFSSEDPADAGNGVVLHEPHALALADVNGDGVEDIVTGERFWGHVAGWPPGLSTPAHLYWFELRRGAGGAACYAAHLIDDASGVGTQVVAGDVDGDGRTDVVVANKKGAFVFLQRTADGG